MKVTCNNCKKASDIDDSLIKKEGSKARCKKCGQIFTVYPKSNEPGSSIKKASSIFDETDETNETENLDETNETENLDETDEIENLDETDEIETDEKLDENSIYSDMMAEEFLAEPIKSIIEELEEEEKKSEKSEPNKNLFDPDDDFLSESVNDDPFKQIISETESDLPDFNVHKPLLPDRNTRTIAILSGKGGTGKTIISISLGNILAHCGFKTLLVDLDMATFGMSFYTLGDILHKAPHGLREAFLTDFDDIHPKPVLLTSPFTNADLSVLPCISSSNILGDLVLNRRYSSVTGFKNKLQTILSEIMAKYHFDYVILDTRGGTDHTSIGAALAAGNYIIVTEIDKPSLEMSRVLIDTIDKMKKKDKSFIRRTGFIINKNVLPPKRIEDYLKKQWQAPHLGTIPLDETAIGHFQENKVPVAESPRCGFSKAILKIIKTAYLSEQWPEDSIKMLKRLSYPKFIRIFFKRKSIYET